MRTDEQRQGVCLAVSPQRGICLAWQLICRELYHIRRPAASTRPTLKIDRHLGTAPIVSSGDSPYLHPLDTLHPLGTVPPFYLEQKWRTVYYAVAIWPPYCDETSPLRYVR